MLKEGGVFAVYVGVIQVGEAITAFSRHLTYRATAFSRWDGDGAVIQNLQCVAQSVPVLVYSNGNWTRTVRWCNTFDSEQPERDLHLWQKPLADTEHWLLSFSDPSDLVCDPCMGSGTTALACHSNRRRFVGGDVDPQAVAIAQARFSQVNDLPTTCRTASEVR